MKLLYLCSKYLYECKMDVNRRSCAEAVGRLLGMDFRVWGKGWDGYNSDQSVEQNITTRLGGWLPDAIWCFNPVDHPTLAVSPWPRVFCFNDAWDRNKRRGELVACEPKLLVFHHENDRKAWKDEIESDGRKHAHVPHVADPERFYRPLDKTRPLPCFVAGVMSADFYPLRDRWRRLVATGRLPGCVRPHPGYRTSDKQATENQVRDYASQLGKARLFLTCSSRFKYPLSKYPEAAMAGCLVVSDMPADAPDGYSDMVAPVKPGWSDDRLVEYVLDLLSNDVVVRQRAEQAQKTALERFTTKAYAERLLAEIRAVL